MEALLGLNPYFFFPCYKKNYISTNLRVEGKGFFIYKSSEHCLETACNIESGKYIKRQSIGIGLCASRLIFSNLSIFSFIVKGCHSQGHLYFEWVSLRFPARPKSDHIRTILLFPFIIYDWYWLPNTVSHSDWVRQVPSLYWTGNLAIFKRLVKIIYTLESPVIISTGVGRPGSRVWYDCAIVYPESCHPTFFSYNSGHLADDPRLPDLVKCPPNDPRIYPQEALLPFVLEVSSETITGTLARPVDSV